MLSTADCRARRTDVHALRYSFTTSGVRVPRAGGWRSGRSRGATSPQPLSDRHRRRWRHEGRAGRKFLGVEPQRRSHAASIAVHWFLRRWAVHTFTAVTRVQTTHTYVLQTHTHCRRAFRTPLLCVHMNTRCVDFLPVLRLTSSLEY